jgi:hypothetical protein
LIRPTLLSTRSIVMALSTARCPSLLCATWVRRSSRPIMSRSQS